MRHTGTLPRAPVQYRRCTRRCGVGRSPSIVVLAVLLAICSQGPSLGFDVTGDLRAVFEASVSATPERPLLCEPKLRRALYEFAAAALRPFRGTLPTTRGSRMRDTRARTSAKSTCATTRSSPTISAGASCNRRLFTPNSPPAAATTLSTADLDDSQKDRIARREPPGAGALWAAELTEMKAAVCRPRSPPLYITDAETR